MPGHVYLRLVFEMKRTDLTPQQKAVKYSQQLRRRLTTPEMALGRALVEHDVWFKSQAPFYSPNGGECYIADFRLAHSYFKLLIEVDGKSHNGRESYDARRTEWLERERNCRVLRFTNERVMSDLDGVLAEILALQPLRGARAVTKKWFAQATT